MPGIVKGESVSCSNPLLPFFHQELGLLLDLYSLRYEIYVPGKAAAVASGVVNTDPCAGGGNRVAQGYYIAPISTTSLDVGAHEILWYYKAAADGAEKKASYMFEVLDQRYFRAGSSYVGYVSSSEEVFTAYEPYVRQQVIQRASREVERLTGRFFFPRYLDIKHSVRPESSMVWLDEPIIGVTSVVVESLGVVSAEVQSTDVDLASLKIYNRHLTGLLSPDDRDNPRISFARLGSASEYDSPSIFPWGEQNVVITGAFGYTDPDGSPFGVTPASLQEVVRILAYREVMDPTGTDYTLWHASSVTKARTRDQELQFGTGGGGGGGAASGGYLTGDPRLDDILVNLMRPTHVGVAG
jgi:hypothetical protein